MASITGFVNDTTQLAHYELIATIADFLENDTDLVAAGQDWEVLRYDTAGENHELIMKGPGLSGTEEVFIGLRAYQSESADYYNIALAGMTGYVPGNAWAAQPGFVQSAVCAHNQRIDYWMAGNGQRLAMGLRVGSPSVFESGYVGKMFPLAKPDQYPYPLVVAGTLVGAPATRYSDVPHSFAFKGNRSNLRMRSVAGAWLQPWAWPWGGQSDFANADAGLNLRDTSGIYTLQPVLLNDNGVNNWGYLDGVYQITGFNSASENTLSIAGKDYVVLGDVWRTGFGDYIALELD